MNDESATDMRAFYQERATVLADQLRPLLAADALGIGSTVMAGGTRYRVVGFDPVGAHDRLVYVENVTTRSRYSVAVEITPE